MLIPQVGDLVAMKNKNYECILGYIQQIHKSSVPLYDIYWFGWDYTSREVDEDTVSTFRNWFVEKYDQA